MRQEIGIPLRVGAAYRSRCHRMIVGRQQLADAIVLPIPTSNTPDLMTATPEPRTFAIEGMSCQHCVGSVQKTLDALDGVAVTEVEIGRATVTAPVGVSDIQIAAALDAAGYPASRAAA